MMATLQDVDKLASVGCEVHGDVVYSARGHAMRCVLNRYQRPSGLIRRYPIRGDMSAPVFPGNSVDGALDADSSLVGGRGRREGRGVKRPREAQEEDGWGKLWRRAVSEEGDGGRLPKKKAFCNSWTKEEHYLFLKGMQQYGHGLWKEISAVVLTKSATQTQSHAQRNFMRREQRVKGKKSIYDLDLDSEDLQEVAARLEAEAAASASQAQPHLEPAPRGCKHRARLGEDRPQEVFMNQEADATAVAPQAEAHPEEASLDDEYRANTLLALPLPLSASQQHASRAGNYSLGPSEMSGFASQQQAQHEVGAGYFYSRQPSVGSGPGVGYHRATKPRPAHDGGWCQNELSQDAQQLHPRYGGGRSAPPSPWRAAPMQGYGAAGGVAHSVVPGDAVKIGGMDSDAYKYTHTPAHASSDHHRQPSTLKSSYLTPSCLSALSPRNHGLGTRAGEGADSAGMTPGGVLGNREPRHPGMGRNSGVGGNSARTTPGDVLGRRAPANHPGTPSPPSNCSYPGSFHEGYEGAVAADHGGPSRAGGSSPSPEAKVRAFHTMSFAERMYLRAQLLGRQLSRIFTCDLN